MILTFSTKPMMGMFRYFITRKSPLSFCLLVSYLAVVLYFIGIIPIHSPYQSFIVLATGIVVVSFPHLFTIKGIKNPYKSIVGETSFKLFGVQGQYLPVNAPELGIFLVGAPGCGKTKYIAEPVLFHMIRKGYSGILYDYDFSNTQDKNYSLSSLAYNCCLHTTGKTKFLSVNFQDLATSARINPITPRHIQD